MLTEVVEAMATATQIVESKLVALEHPGPSGHQAVHRLQLYSADAQLLIKNVGEFIREGLDRGEGVLIVATPDHVSSFEQYVLSGTGRGARSPLVEAKASGQILFLDAGELLGLLLSGGSLDYKRFENIVGGVMEKLRPRVPGTPSRAFGEMVGLLWERGEFETANRLEDYWNKLLDNGNFQLFCAYPIDVFSPEFHSPEAAAVLCSHTHLLPSGDRSAVETAVNRAGTDLFESRKTPSPAGLPEGEAKILWLHENLPEAAGKILADARRHYDHEKRFRALVENSSDAVALTDPQGCILYASPSTARILGYDPASITGRQSTDLIHPADRDPVYRAMFTILRRPRTPVQMEFRARHREGHWCWIECTGSNLLEEPDIEAVTFNFRDITSRKAIETALRESEASLREANAGLEQFAYAAAHDLQEPIRNVAIYIELLAEKYQDKLDAEANHFIKVATEGALRMQTLTRDLLAFTRSLDDPRRHTEPKCCITDSNRVFDEVTANLALEIARTRARVTRDDLPALPVQSAHLVLLLQNLIGNSLKYRSNEPPEVHVSARPGHEEWIVSVADNGIGVPPEYQDHIFGIFKRLHGRELPGNGIGLAICARVVNHYQGKIWVRPRSGGGSIFSFTVTTPDARGGTRSR
jgi:PAS domain S-box-containing protein